MSGTNSDVTSGITRALPTGVALGVGAFVVNYVLMYVFVTLDGVELGSADSWKLVGMVLYNAHNVAAELSSPVLSQSFNLLSGELLGTQIAIGSTVPSFAYQVVPLVVLLLAGFAVAKVAGAVDPVEGALAGATITVGYLVLAAIGVFLFSINQQGASIGPNVVMGIVLAGIVYPVIAGAIGGAGAGATN